MFTFGPILDDQGDVKFELGVSDDNRALTLTFSDLEVAVGGLAPVSLATRVFSLVLPLEDGQEQERAEIEFVVQGLLLALEGATATIVCSVNGQTTVTDFSGKSDQSFVQRLTFAAEKPSEARLCVVLLLGRDSGQANAEALLRVTAIDVEILPRPESPS